MSEAARSKRLDAFELMIAKGSKDPFIFYGRAMELRSLGRAVDAFVAFEELTAAFPAYVPTYLMAAQVARELGRIDAAREIATRGLDAARRAGDAHAASELETFGTTLVAP